MKRNWFPGLLTSFLPQQHLLYLGRTCMSTLIDTLQQEGPLHRQIECVILTTVMATEVLILAEVVALSYTA